MHERVMEVARYLRTGGDPQVAANTLEQIARLAPRAAPALKPLTRKQRRVFDFVRAYTVTQGCSPTHEVVALHFGFRSLATVSEHLTHLQEKGWVTREYNRAGTLQVTPEAANA